MRKQKYNKAGKVHLLIQDASILFCLLLALVVLGVGFKYIRHQEKQAMDAYQPSKTQTSLPSVEHKGIWLWQSPSAMTDENTRDMLGVMTADQINNVYIDISSYIDFFELPDGAVKQAKILELQKNLQAYVRAASGRNIKVHGLAGHTSWGTNAQSYIPSRFIDFVNQYNMSVQENERLTGMQFDIESYNEPTFDADKKGGLIQYMSMVSTTLQHYKDARSSFAIGFTIPYWFDNENGNIPEITINKKTAPIAYHLFDSLNPIPGSYVVIMDYRNTIEGKDGSIAHAQNEIVYASKYAPNVGTIIGQETTDVQPAKISFYSKTYPEFTTALQGISNSFKPFGSYSGIAIHDYKGYVALRKKT